MDIFKKINSNMGALGEYGKESNGYFVFPKLEGNVSSKMRFRNKEVLVWCQNNYLGLANNEQVRQIDNETAAEWGFAYPMGARMISGQTIQHEELETDLANFVGKEDACLLNYGYQGMVSIIDCLIGRNDVIVYDTDVHACVIDGLRLHLGKRFAFQHNDIDNLRKQLTRATWLTEETGGGILLVTQGVFGISGDLGKLDSIVDLKKEFQFRLLIDDAHGFGTMGATGAGTVEHFGVTEGVDLYYGTFSKAMASVGGFVAGNEDVINYLRFNMRSQIYSSSMFTRIVVGIQKRLKLLNENPSIRENLWNITHLLQDGLRQKGLDIGNTNSQITPVFLNGSIAEASELMMDLRENHNIFCSIIVYPIIPKEKILLRLAATSEHLPEDVEYTVNSLAHIQEKLISGGYR